MFTAEFPAFKSFFLVIYGAFGIFYFLAACDCRRRRFVALFDTAMNRILLRGILIFAAGLLLVMFAAVGCYLLLGAVVTGISIFFVRYTAWKAPSTLIPATSAATLVLSLVWWRIAPNAAAPLPLAAFALIAGCLTVCLSDPGKHQRHALAIFMILFPITGFLLLADLGDYSHNSAALLALAHHWGAFVGPALHLGTGLVPFYDVPLQYGLGPTLVIAAVCDAMDCWTGTECIVITMNLVSGLLLLRMTLATAVSRGPLWQLAATIVIFAAIFFWSGSPSSGSILLATPSVAALRFLPTTLVAYLLFFARPAAAAAALVPSVLWSPESAAMSVAVFGLCETARLGFTSALLRAGVLLAGSYSALVLSHRAIFAVWMDPAAFAEYVLHVPGPLPVNPVSDAMLLVAVLGIGGWLLVLGSPDQVTARRDRTATVLLFAASSYCLGRSHPNNICNLMPFLVLVGFRALDRPTEKCSLLADVTSFGLVTSVAALAMSPWQSVPYDRPATVDILAIVANFWSLEPDIEQIRQQIPNPDGLGIADFGRSYTRHTSEKLVWTPMDPSSLWTFVPSERRQLYIQRSSARLQRSGWGIFDDSQRLLFDDLGAGYTVAMQRSFLGAPGPTDGSQRHYIAACFDPRPDIAASHVGPACPSQPRLAQ